jgi:hypothetical protein
MNMPSFGAPTLARPSIGVNNGAISGVSEGVTSVDMLWMSGHDGDGVVGPLLPALHEGQRMTAIQEELYRRHAPGGRTVKALTDHRNGDR